MPAGVRRCIWKGALVLNESRTGTTRVRDPTQRVACVPPPGWVCLNTFHVDYGTPAQAMAALRLYGIDPFSGGEVDGAEEGVFELIKQLFEVRRVPGAYGMLQRMSLCLKGLGNAVGSAPQPGPHPANPGGGAILDNPRRSRRSKGLCVRKGATVDA